MAADRTGSVPRAGIRLMSSSASKRPKGDVITDAVRFPPPPIRSLQRGRARSFRNVH